MSQNNGKILNALGPDYGEKLKAGNHVLHDALASEA